MTNEVSVIIGVCTLAGAVAFLVILGLVVLA